MEVKLNLNQSSFIRGKEQLDNAKLHVQAEKLISEKRLEEASEIFCRILCNNETDVKALHSLAVINHRTGQFDAARTLYLHALKVDPERPKIIFNLGRLEHEVKRRDAAKMHYETALSMECDQELKCSTLAYLGLLLLEDFDDLYGAEECFEKSLVLNPKHVRTLDHQSALLVRQDRRDEAALLHEIVISLSPEHRKCWCPYFNSLFDGRLVKKCDTGRVSSFSFTEKMQSRWKDSDFLHNARRLVEKARMNRSLDYYANSDSYQNGLSPRGTILLSGCNVERDKDDSSVFVIRDNVKKRTYECRCSDEFQMKSWIDHLKQIVEDDRRKAIDRRPTIFTEEESAKKGSPKYTGWMKKRGWYNSSWRDRFFVLSGTSLEYYVSSDAFAAGQDPQGCISLKSCLAQPKAGSGNHWELTIRDNMKRRTFECACVSETDRSKWILAIESCNK
ncbi:hypothetical protein GUITHDRAFT_103110 [Guillardia theta CCMP2712]|uniref:PH domain-containing protein n=1 Tax=Guillardia theta (strain CCMP2712) TaxID=905079 RepID=L1JSB0_GUITC|nr:hypothetical protein GUITHDRAFT_103110 [Guillardia theta CCMP2712]EKX51194.1 hypothetical protein GUITHDRAFT_103110 [Guillardia theta CCMP2712]|eukprot:XP_005838174.1 hypothetical protein GUITHDRAFT_103110 [Guillardia theta CCMP2712]